MSDAVAARLRAAGLTGRTVTLKVRFGDFTTITRSHTLAGPVDTGVAIARAAALLLDHVEVDPGVRLLGVSMANLSRAGGQQLAMEFGPADPEEAGPGSAESADLSWHEATRAIDQVRARFGATAVGPAVLLDGGELRLKRPGDTQWGPGTPPAVPPDDAVPPSTRAAGGSDADG
jgi:DNA polymerase-4